MDHLKRGPLFGLCSFANEERLIITGKQRNWKLMRVEGRGVCATNVCAVHVHPLYLKLSKLFCQTQFKISPTCIKSAMLMQVLLH